MFLWNNIFFSLGFDVKDHYKDFGGDEAAHVAPVSFKFTLPQYSSPTKFFVMMILLLPTLFDKTMISAFSDLNNMFTSQLHWSYSSLINVLSRLLQSSDLQGVKAYSQIDTEGLYTLGTVIVDYRGYRVTAQSIIPGK